MDQYVIVMIGALIGAALSFFSGFGLGTLLLPAFMLFFPPELAVAATAVVHMLNNIFKLFLVGKYAYWPLIIRFGVFSVVGAIGGAWLLEGFVKWGPITTYTLNEHSFEITYTKLIIGILIIVFVLLESGKALSNATLGKNWMPIGGLISGFFGGLSGHQGALRSAFLMKAGLSKEAFIGSRVVIACLVDLSRLSIYAVVLNTAWQKMDYGPMVAATLAAFAGAWLGNKWMKKTDFKWIHRIITIALLIFGLALCAGWI